MSTHPFWSWFTANETKLRAINTLPENDRHELLCRFSKHLHNYSPKIATPEENAHIEAYHGILKRDLFDKYE